jgi:anthranilate phosphoribosyltransferase
VYDVNSQLFNGKYNIEPKAFGLSLVKKSSILGGTPETNARIAMDVLEGKKQPHRDIVIANAALALMATPKVRVIQEAVQITTESIDSGNALRKLQQLRDFSQS